MEARTKSCDCRFINPNTLDSCMNFHSSLFGLAFPKAPSPVTGRQLLLRSLMAVSACVSITACGGGDNPALPDTSVSPTSTAAAGLVGEWVGCFNDGTSSEGERFVFAESNPASTNALAFTLEYKTYGSLDCSGIATSSDTASGTLTLDGTKSIGTATAERITFNVTTPAPETFKQVFVIDGNFITPGEDPTTDLDAQGYPNQLDTSGKFTRQ